MNRRAFTVVGGTVLVAVLLVFVVVYQTFVLNPRAASDHTQIVGVGMALREVICAQAEVQANSTRTRQIDPSGNAETVRHFSTRLEAQRHALQLSRGIGCSSAPGFPPFRLQVSRALRDIDGILANFGPKQTKPIDGNPLPEPVEPNLVLPNFTPEQQAASEGSEENVGESTEHGHGGKPSGPTSPPAPSPPPVASPPEPPTSQPATQSPASPEPSPEQLPGIVVNPGPIQPEVQLDIPREVLCVVVACRSPNPSFPSLGAGGFLLP